MSRLIPRKSGDASTECRDPPLPQDFKIPVLYKDEQILVVDKPYDIRVDGAFPVTVEKLVREGLGIQLDKFRLCNQLDYSTSGLMVIGLSKSGARNCNKLFSERRTSKWYLAVGNGDLQKGHSLGEKISVKAKILEPPDDFRMIIDEDRGLESESILVPVKSGLIFELPDQKILRGTLFIVKLVTGRRHQIRLHMRHAGYAIVGDATYGERPEGLHRMMLHAWKLKLPFTQDNPVQVTASIPREFLGAPDSAENIDQLLIKYLI